MIDLTNESGHELDDRKLLALGAFSLDYLRIHPEAELSLVIVDEETMAHYHEKFLDEPGPTDVMSFPMDEIRAPKDGEEATEGLLGDIMLCPPVIARQATEAGRSFDEEAEYLLVHGLLHLLGHDHMEAGEKKIMFDLNDEIIAAWRAHQA